MFVLNVANVRTHMRPYLLCRKCLLCTLIENIMFTFKRKLAYFILTIVYLLVSLINVQYSVIYPEFVFEGT